jgi:hypothetical protein
VSILLPRDIRAPLRYRCAECEGTLTIEQAAAFERSQRADADQFEPEEYPMCCMRSAAELIDHAIAINAMRFADSSAVCESDLAYAPARAVIG